MESDVAEGKLGREEVIEEIGPEQMGDVDGYGFGIAQ